SCVVEHSRFAPCSSVFVAALKRSRIHPLAVLVAQEIYAQGHCDQCALKWSPVSAIMDALEAAFYATFSNVEPCNKPVLLTLDVSGSMACSMIAGSCISARGASAAVALIRAGNSHPAQALRQYHSEFVGDAQAVVVGMTSNG